MKYVDGYVLPVPKKNLRAYRRIAQKAGKVWRKHGALEYFECVGDDLSPKWAGIRFPRTVRLKPGETVVFSFIVFRSRAHRDSRQRKSVQRSDDVRSGLEGSADALRPQAHGLRRIQSSCRGMRAHDLSL